MCGSVGKAAMIGVVTLAGIVACSSRGRTERRQPNTATADQWEGQNVRNAEELLAARFPGVHLSLIPGGVRIQIRGASTITGSTEPLYVLDGMTIQPGPGGALMGINPMDIEKIEVLNDIGATSRYGTQGANGVIIITTKH
jgi:TonB-dependent SusC/RagA subfamily outer membrane receptor